MNIDKQPAGSTNFDGDLHDVIGHLWPDDAATICGPNFFRGPSIRPGHGQCFDCTQFFSFRHDLNVVIVVVERPDDRGATGVITFSHTRCGESRVVTVRQESPGQPLGSDPA